VNVTFALASGPPFADVARIASATVVCDDAANLLGVAVR